MHIINEHWNCGFCGREFSPVLERKYVYAVFSDHTKGFLHSNYKSTKERRVGTTRVLSSLVLVLYVELTDGFVIAN